MIILIPLLYLTFKVFKIVRFNEKSMLLMMFFLILELISRISYYILMAQWVGTSHTKENTRLLVFA
jgi:hypothetical protein